MVPDYFAIAEVTSLLHLQPAQSTLYINLLRRTRAQIMLFSTGYLQAGGPPKITTLLAEIMWLTYIRACLCCIFDRTTTETTKKAKTTRGGLSSLPKGGACAGRRGTARER